MTCIRLLTGLVLLLCSNLLLALPEDRNLPLQIQAQRMTWQHQQQLAVYAGQVDAQQGELHLQSEVLNLYRNQQGDILRIIARSEGAQAYLRDIPDPEQGQLEAWAEEIDYHPQEQRLVLTGQARILQGQDQFRGHRLVYQLDTQDIQASQSEDGSSERIEIILSPRQESTP